MNSLGRIRCFLLDLDGTFYLGNRLLPGSLPFIDFLHRTGRDFLFLTNNSSHKASFYAKKITAMGCPVGTDQIVTSGEAAALYMQRLHPGARLYLLGTPDLVEEMDGYGFVFTDQDPDYVVVGFDTTLTYEKLVKTCDFIRQGVPYIATHPDINCPTETGYIPDCGAITALIKASTGKDPIRVIGKPNRDIIEVVQAKRKYALEEFAVVGDRLYTDIAAGNNAGVTSILVLTGESDRQDAARSAVKPVYIFRDLAAIARAIQEEEDLR